MSNSTLYPAIFVIAAVLIVVPQFLRWLRMKRQDFGWYKRTHPGLVAEGEVKCRSCGAARTNVRGLGNRTYMREHFCAQCGTTLYYSPEG